MDTVEGRLNSLGSIHIFLGWVSGILSIVVGIAEDILINYRKFHYFLILI